MLTCPAVLRSIIEERIEACSWTDGSEGVNVGYEFRERTKSKEEQGFPASRYNAIEVIWLAQSVSLPEALEGATAVT